MPSSPLRRSSSLASFSSTWFSLRLQLYGLDRSSNTKLNCSANLLDLLWERETQISKPSPLKTEKRERMRKEGKYAILDFLFLKTENDLIYPLALLNLKWWFYPWLGHKQINPYFGSTCKGLSKKGQGGTIGDGPSDKMISSPHLTGLYGQKHQ